MAQVGTLTFRRYKDTSIDIINATGTTRRTTYIALQSAFNSSFTVQDASSTPPSFKANTSVTIFSGYEDSVIYIPIIFYRTSTTTYVRYYDGENYITVPYSSFGPENTYTDFILPLFDTIESSATNVSFSTNSGTINANVAGESVTVSNVPVTKELSGDVSVVINVDSHMPKDSYSVNINNGENMTKIVDGSSVYNSFPVTITVGANKAITAYGEPDKTITVKYENTSVPIITNS